MPGPSNQRGFTLIEVVVVITILGILAAFAVPRFESMEVQGRASATRALGGNVRSAAALAHALWLAQGQPPAVPMEGRNIVIANGYPTAASINTTLPDMAGFTFAGGVWTSTGANDDAGCRVTYTPPTAVGTAPSIAALATSC